ncbi:MAG: helix-turn-helix transcriptional regulator [Coprobacillus sp.]
MDVLARIRFFMDKNNWSEYKLSKISGIPQSTINSMFKCHNNPSLYTLEILCRAFHISLSDFFQEVDNQNLFDNLECKEVLERWELLSANQKNIILQTMNAFIETKHEKPDK